MTQEEKAKAYDDAVERIATLLGKDGTVIGRYWLEKIFPQLAESEDERIRKWIKKELESKYVVDNIVNNMMANKAFAYLEKQKDKDKCPEFCVRSHCIGCSIYEKQKEQKPISFNEPYNSDDYEVVMEGNATGLRRKVSKPGEIDE